MLKTKSDINCWDLLVKKKDSHDLARILRQTRELSKLFQSKFKIDKTTSSRIVFHLILKEIASGKFPLFKDKKIEQILHRFGICFDEKRVDIGAIKTNPDLIDPLYESLVDQSYRKAYGQFFTPDYIAEFMSSWISLDKPKIVLDPAVGTGIFLKKFVQTNRPSEVELIGYDVDPLLLNACMLRLTLLNVKDESIHLEAKDFLTQSFLPKKFDSAICNPPYLNFHNFDRDNLLKNLEARFGVKLSRLTNIYVLFFIQSLLMAKDGSRVAFITPSEFLYTGYGEELKSFLLKHAVIDALVLADFEALVFNKALTTAVITLFRKGHANPDHKVKFIKVYEWTTTAEMLDTVEKGTKNHPRFHVREYAQNKLNPLEKWLKHFETINHTPILSNLIALSEIADVDRGIATGYNKYFVMNETTAREWGIENQFLVPVISKTVHCKGCVFKSEDWQELKKDGERVFLLYCFDEPTPNLRRYIEHGKKLGADQRYLTRHRKPWYSMEKKEPATILATVFHRKSMRFVLNSANVRNLTAFHCVYPKFDGIKSIKALLAYLNSNICKDIQRTRRREYGGGLHKFEPRDLEQIPVPDVTQLDDEDLQALASMFDTLCEAFGNDKDEMETKRGLDSLLKSILLSNKEHRKC